MSEEREFCSKFEKECTALRSKKVMLYGTGEKTKFLLENVRGFHFEGILDPQLENEYIFNTKVYPIQEAAIRKCSIIIVARDHIVNIIFARIQEFCNRNEIDVYDVHGNKLPYAGDRGISSDIKYWGTGVSDIRKTIAKYDIISFDIFDTLIQRTTLTLADMFQLMEVQGMVPRGFAKYRIGAERECQCQGIYNISDIYHKMAQSSGWKDERLQKYCAAELSMEKRILQPRKHMAALLQWAVDIGKKIYLVSDMYWMKDVIIQLLRGMGISNYQQILVSCEEHKSKKSGELFQELKKIVKSDHIIHIGDNRIDDIRMAEKCGLDTIQIMSAYELLMLSDMQGFLNSIHTFQDRIVLGMIMAKLFSDPFSLNKYKGRVYLDNRDAFIYCFLSPIIYNKKLHVEDQLLLAVYNEFLEDFERLYGIRNGEELSPEFENALTNWMTVHDDRITLEMKKLLLQIQKL